MNNIIFRINKFHIEKNKNKKTTIFINKHMTTQR